MRSRVDPYDPGAKGMVLEIERFATHDGPGIRTVVFLKGCPLRCLWCSTADAQSGSPEMEMFEERCQGCGLCIEACPRGAVSRADDGRIRTDRACCDACGQCANECPAGARKVAGRVMTAAEVVEEVSRDAVFYANSGGGLTLSGGEPAMQGAFAEQVLTGCSAIGIHAAMETSGYANWDTLKRLVMHLDLVYIDIKHLSSARHWQLTARSNGLIQDNAGKIAGQYPSVDVVFRVTVVPGVNDSDDNLLDTARFVRHLGPAYAIELLPYHRLGIHRHHALGRDYGLSDVQPPSGDRMRYLRAMVQSAGVKVLCDA